MSISEKRLARIGATVVIAIMVALFVFLLIKFYPYTMDDSFITFRYAKNFYSGSGLVFNASEVEPAEGLTSPLYAIIASQAFLLNIDIVLFSKLLGVTACIATAVIIYRVVYIVTRRATSLSRADAWIPSALGALFYVTNPYVVANSISGMETAVATAVFGVFLSLAIVKLRPGCSHSRVDVVLLGAAAVSVPLFRPEMGVTVAVVLIGCYAMVRDIRKRIVYTALVFTVLGVAYYIVRYSYYGLPMPLPFYVKQDSAFGMAGVSEVVSYGKAGLFMLPLFAFAILYTWISRRRSSDPSMAVIVAIGLAVGCQLLYYASIKHIMGFGYRYFQPVNMGVVVVASVGASYIISYSRRYIGRVRKYVSSIVAALFVMSAMNNVWHFQGAYKTFIEWYTPLESRVVSIGNAMRKASRGSDIAIALNDCGAIPFYTGFTTTDMAGLNNRAIALGGTPLATISELRRRSPQVVMMVAGSPHEPASIFGWERLGHSDIINLGYDYYGTIRVGERYVYMVYSKCDDQTSEDFLRELVNMRIMDRAGAS